MRAAAPPVVPDQLQAIAQLTWPDLIEVRGCVLRAECYEPTNFESWWETTGGQPSRIEHVLNEEHLYDAVRDYDPSQLEMLEAVGQRIASAWRSLLASSFPDRRFTVTFASEPEEYGPTVSFHQTDGCPACAALEGG